MGVDDFGFIFGISVGINISVAILLVAGFIRGILQNGKAEK